MHKSLRARGFTLVELLVGAAVGAVVMAGISLTFISQAQQYQSHASRRGIQANGRQSLAFLERHLRVAGYGVDPDRAIIGYDSYDAVNDAQGEGFPDAFVVHWRDPLFRRTIQAVDPTTITLAPSEQLKEPMRRGQILMVICAPNPSAIQSVINEFPPHAFVMVNTYAPVGATTIELDPTPPLNAPNSPVLGPGRFFHEQAALGPANPCFHDNTHPPLLVLVHRAAFYVAMFDDDGDPATPERTPYLMMHQGLDMPSATSPDGDSVIDANDAVPVAEGIEQLQVAYILYTDDDDIDRTPLIRGVTQPMGVDYYGENWDQLDADLRTVPGWYFNPPKPGSPNRRYDRAGWAVVRQKDHPANIRQVRMTLVARSAIPDPQIPGDNLMEKPDGTPYPKGPLLLDAENSVAWRHLENLTEGPVSADFKPSGGHFYRTIVRESVAPKNLGMSRQFIPVNPQGGG
jgi:type IV pilus assembly protein PilW